jgi:hypothetical protein
MISRASMPGMAAFAFSFLFTPSLSDAHLCP